MPKIFFGSNRNIQVPVRGTAVNNMNSGEKQYFDIDKYSIETWQRLVNVFTQYGNLRVREGISELSNSITDTILGTHIYKYGTNDILVCATTDTTDTKIIKVDRGTGAVSDLSTGITGTDSCDFVDLRGFLYMANNQTAVQIYDGDADTTSTITPATGNIKLVTADNKRLWVVEDGDNGDALYFSKSETGQVTSFASTGTNLDRGGIAQTNIVRINALEASGKTVLVAGANRIELHRIPSLETLGSFPSDISTVIAEYPNIGVSNKKAVIAVGDIFYCMCNDGVLRTISKSGSIKNNFNVKRLFETYLLDSVSLGYDQKNNNIIIATKESGDNDRAVVFNQVDESFSEFTNLFAQEFAFDESNIYCFDNNNVFYDCFKEDTYTDEGVNINIVLRSQALYLDNKNMDKHIIQYGIHTKYRSTPLVKVNIYVDKSEFSDNSSFSDEVLLPSTIDLFNGNPEPLGLGVWGALMFDLNADRKRSENYTDKRDVGVCGNRFEVEFETSINNVFDFKAFDLYYKTTSKQIYNVDYT